MFQKSGIERNATPKQDESADDLIARAATQQQSDKNTHAKQAAPMGAAPSAPPPRTAAPSTDTTSTTINASVTATPDLPASAAPVPTSFTRDSPPSDGIASLQPSPLSDVTDVASSPASPSRSLADTLAQVQQRLASSAKSKLNTNVTGDDDQSSSSSTSSTEEQDNAPTLAPQPDDDVNTLKVNQTFFFLLLVFV